MNNSHRPGTSKALLNKLGRTTEANETFAKAKELGYTSWSWVKVTENNRRNRMQEIHFDAKCAFNLMLALFSKSRTRPKRNRFDIIIESRL